MAPPPNVRVGTLLRYTYRANIVFFAAFATWYVFKGPEQKELAKQAPEQKIVEARNVRE